MTRRFKLQILINVLAQILAQLVLINLTHAAAAPSKTTDGKKHIASRILLKMKDGKDIDTAVQSVGGKRGAKLAGIDVHIIELPAPASERAAIDRLKQNPNVDFAELDELLPPPAPQATPDDAYYSSAWHLNQVQAPLAWDATTGSGIIVAILDTGLNSLHEDLAGQIIDGWNFYNNTANFTDVYGHGTKVAGVVAALTNNSIGVSAIAGSAKLLAAKVSGDDGYGSLSAMANAIAWAATKGARVVNMSYSVEDSSTLVNATANFRSKGGVVVHSSGNSGALKTIADNNMIAVAATSSSDARASWSSYGPYVDVAAPGVGIWTTTANGGYGSPSGTSFSSPLTAAVVALIMSANPKLSPDQVEKILESTVVDLGAAGRDDYYGHGRVDAFAAVIAAKNTVADTADYIAPATEIVSPTSGSTISGIVSVQASASDNIGVSQVDLYVNGKLLTSDSTSPYSFSLNSANYADGNITLQTQARDAAGNVGSSSQLSVIVKNAAEPVPVVPPQVLAINPNQVKTGQSVDSTISGSGFKAGLKVTLSGGSGSAPSVRLISVSADGLTAIVKITSKSSGRRGASTAVKWNLNVTNSDGGTSTLSQAFTVNP